MERRVAHSILEVVVGPCIVVIVVAAPSVSESLHALWSLLWWCIVSLEVAASHPRCAGTIEMRNAHCMFKTIYLLKLLVVVYALCADTIEIVERTLSS